MKKIKVIIEATPGSEFQYIFLQGVIGTVIEAIKSYAESRHRKNKIAYEIQLDEVTNHK